MSRSERIPDVPPFAIALGELVSKADLLEALWDIAELPGIGAGEELVRLRRIVDAINRGRARRGRRPQVLPRELREALEAGRGGP